MPACPPNGRKHALQRKDTEVSERRVSKRTACAVCSCYHGQDWSCAARPPRHVGSPAACVVAKHQLARVPALWALCCPREWAVIHTTQPWKAALSACRPTQLASMCVVCLHSGPSNVNNWQCPSKAAPVLTSSAVHLGSLMAAWLAALMTNHIRCFVPQARVIWLVTARRKACIEGGGGRPR